MNCLSSYQHLNIMRTQSVKYHCGQPVCQRTSMCKCCITITHPSTHTHTHTHTQTHSHTYQVQSVEQLFPRYVLRGIANISTVFRAKNLIGQEPNHIT
jgi:hypothetical protein